MKVATGFIYLSLSLSFLATGLILIMRLKKNFHFFYESIKRSIWWCMGLLSATLMIRGTLDIVRFADESGLDSEYEESYIENTYFASLFDAILFILCDMLPISAQLLSLIFGILRKRLTGGDRASALDMVRQNAQSVNNRDSQVSMGEELNWRSSFFDPPVEDYSRLNFVHD